MSLVLALITLFSFFHGSCGVNVLIFGGNGFIGSHVFEKLKYLDYRITFINRGNLYYNTKKTMESFRTIKCDRNTLLRKSCMDLLSGETYDFVLDFSSYREQQIEQVIEILRNRVGLYVFISTDAVYDTKTRKRDGPAREVDISSDTVNQPRDLSKYASNKLDCERALVKQRKFSGFPYVILRLATVIGERDTTLRWWIYQVLMKVHRGINIKVPLPKAVKKINHSMVYAGDVASAIIKILEKPAVLHDQVINLAFKESVNLEKLLDSIADCLKLANVTYDYDIDTAWFKYPAVQMGPIDTAKAELILEWSPITFLDASKRTCRFFEKAMTDSRYIKDKELMLAELLEEGLPEDFIDELHFFDVLKKEYGIEVMKGIDLGFDEMEKLIEEKKDETKNEL